MWNLIGFFRVLNFLNSEWNVLYVFFFREVVGIKIRNRGRNIVNYLYNKN